MSQIEWSKSDQAWWDAHGEEWLRSVSARLETLEGKLDAAKIVEAPDYLN